MQSVDIVGDVHGQSDELEKLLIKMGYLPFEKGFRHAERTLIMVGDLIDGTGSVAGQRRVVEIAQSMVQNGDAKVTMGNHEFNAICYATRMPHGGYARPHSDNNTKQHQLFLNAFAFGSDEYHHVISFFKSLPLWLETPDFRVVHACWNDAAMERLAPMLDDDHRLISDEVIKRFSREEEPLFDDVELVLKGPEVTLPDGVSFQDRYGHTRYNTRVRWWYKGSEPSKMLAFEEDLQQYDLTSTYHAATLFRYIDTIPVFFGHYWMPPESFDEEVLNYPAVCLDYSVARKGGELVAIRLNETLDDSEWFNIKRDD